MWCCCALTRRQLLRGALATGVVSAAGCARPSPAQRRTAQRLVQDALSVDLHSHPGMLSWSRLTTDQHLRKLAEGRVNVALFCAVADGAVLAYRQGRGISATREPRPGELYAYTYQALQPLQTRIDAGQLALVKSARDLETARTATRPAAILATEGGDFLEGRLDRVQEAYERGIRSIQLVHYRVNELGDIQTEPAVHGGLTAFGKDVIREMNRLGMLIDLAHGTLEDVKTAVDVSTKPMIVSHTNLQNSSGWARFISPEHARLVTARGGVIGSMPIARGVRDFDGFIDEIMRLIDAVGVDHVAIGTDMDGIVRQNVLFDDYAQWPSIPASLLARGVSVDDIAKILGGNFRRLFHEVTAT
jgi:membrane dipeptidase